MYVDICKYKRGNKTYKRVLLREGYREGGKVKHRTLANLSHCSDEEIEAIRIALKMKKNLVELKNLAKGSYWCGKHVGPVAVLYQIANHLGITVKEGISRLAKITSNVIAIGEKRLVTLPRPDKACKELLKQVNVSLPEVLPYRETHVATRKKLNSLRKRK